MSGRLRRAATGALLLGAVATALAGCGIGGGASAAPSWVPKPDVLPPVDGPTAQLPGQALPLPHAPGEAPEPGAPGQGGAANGAHDAAVVATGLREPWGLVILPDGWALVGERTTGRILRVDPRGRVPARQAMRIDGVDGSGDGGLLGLALSPAYRQDHLIFAYVTTAADNRILRFTLGGQPTPILTGLPRGRTGNGGRITFGPDGMLYVGTGDAGDPAAAADPRNLAGKVLRLDVFGHPAPGNPTPGSPVYSLGHGDLAGLCWSPTRQLLSTENDGGVAELNAERPGGDYGWPSTPPRTGVEAPLLRPAASLRPVGGCAVVQFGLFVASLGGKQLLAIPLDGAGRPGTVTPLLVGTYGRLRTVVAAPDGALWLTTANRVGGRPSPTDDRVIRIVPPQETTSSPV